MAPSQTQCTATAPAVHCIRPCSALRLSLQTFATVPANVCGIRRLSGRNGSLVAGYVQSKVQHLHFEPCPSAIFITLMTDSGVSGEMHLLEDSEACKALISMCLTDGNCSDIAVTKPTSSPPVPHPKSKTDNSALSRYFCLLSFRY